jgi:hypothetical protein
VDEVDADVLGTAVEAGGEMVEVAAVDVGGAEVDEQAATPQAHAATTTSATASLRVRCSDDWCTVRPIVGVAGAIPAIGTIAHATEPTFVMLDHLVAGTVRTP